MPVITEDRIFHYAEEGYVFGAEYRNAALANDGTLFLKVTATTKPVTLVFGAGVEALTWVNSYSGTTLTTPTTLTPYNYLIGGTEVATATIQVATAASVLGTQRGNTQVGSGAAGTGVGGSTTSRPTTLKPGNSVTLALTNKGGTAKSVSVGVYFTEIEG